MNRLQKNEGPRQNAAGSFFDDRHLTHKPAAPQGLRTATEGDTPPE